jgi:hypothetical protein
MGGKEFMRVIRETEHERVFVMDEAGEGNACHDYNIVPADVDANSLSGTRVVFQRGPIQEHGVNGCQNEDLLAIVIDRLQGFQSGNFACRENAIALTKIQEALMWLEKRTSDRKARGVEGKSVI